MPQDRSSRGGRKGGNLLPPAWRYFFLFLFSNSLLSFFNFPPGLRLGVGLLGLALPLGLAFWKAPQSFPDPTLEEFLPQVPAWVLFLLGAAAVGERFYHLTSLSVWPFYDDGLWGWMALKSNEQGIGLFPEGANFPAAYAWGLALLFKWFKPSLFTLWFYPALVSVLTLGAGYAASRLFFSRSFCFLLGLMLCFGFWPLYLGRIGDQMGLVLLAECAWAGLLGWFLRAEDAPSRWKRALALGAACGAGFYIFISWATVAAFGALAVMADGLRRKPRTWKPFLLFALGFLLLLLPLFHAGLWSSIRSYGSGAGWGSQGWDLSRQLGVSLSYLGVLFWGMDPAAYTYQPSWGGFLDPILGAFFFLGFWELARRGWKQALGWAAAFLFFLIPGMATSSREPLRVLPVLPLLLVVCAMGWRSLLAAGGRERRVLVLAVLGLSFAALDFYHLAVRYHRIWDSPENWAGYGKSMERYRAHLLLDRIAQDQGPGLLYDGFTPGLCDPSLAVEAYSYNAARNPSLSFPEARWAAVLSNVNFKPFLQKRFPQGRAFALSQGLLRPDGGFMLFVTPVAPDDRPFLQKWQGASKAFECPPHQDAWVLKPMLEKAAPAFEGDPFLQACYWEKLSDLSYRASGFKDLGEALKDLSLAAQKGYPSAHLYWRMGTFDLMEGDKVRAREAFERARRAPLDMTTSGEILSVMGAGAERKSP